MNENESLIASMGNDAHIKELSLAFLRDTAPYRYTYNFSWLGRPIIQTPQDMVAMQEIIWEVQPDLIIETGIAHGGSLVFYASLLQLLGGDRRVLGVDIEIREHNRNAIQSHPLSHRIDLIEGSSIDPLVVEEVKQRAKGRKCVLVTLDSNHTHEHVLAELLAYSPLVSRGSYLVVFDTTIEDMPDELYPGKPWNKRSNPKTAVREFIKKQSRFEVDSRIHNKLMITVAIEGYLKCVRD